MFDLYSQRIKNKQGEPEVYEYEVFSQQFRNQVFYIISDVFDCAERNGRRGFWESFHGSFAREIGLKALSSYGQYNDRRKTEQFVSEASEEDFLDLVDYAFHIIHRMSCDPNLQYHSQMMERIKAAMTELNYRFTRHNLGYEFVNGEILRKDNELLHQEVIKPALKLLLEAGFEGAEQEFLEAFEHRRKGENKDAMADALKAFESTMKAICAGCSYPYNPEKNTAKDLIVILEKSGFYPTYMNSHISALRTTLESGLPTLRNKKAGHGQGETIVVVSDEFAEYALNLAATNIVLLVKIYAGREGGAE